MKGDCPAGREINLQSGPQRVSFYRRNSPELWQQFVFTSLGPMRFRESESERLMVQGARTRDALTVEEPGDVRGGRPLGLARNRSVFPVECGHVSRRVDQHGRRGCNGRDVSYVVLNGATYSWFCVIVLLRRRRPTATATIPLPSKMKHCTATW